MWETYTKGEHATTNSAFRTRVHQAFPRASAVSSKCSSFVMYVNLLSLLFRLMYGGRAGVVHGGGWDAPSDRPANSALRSLMH